MKLILKILFVFSFFILGISSSEAFLLKGSVEKIPDTFFGSWRVVSKLKSTDSPVTFKLKGVDLWNLSQENNVIKLSNPFSGATADISIKDVSGNSISFTKIGQYDNKIVTDSVSILLNENNFIFWLQDFSLFK